MGLRISFIVVTLAFSIPRIVLAEPKSHSLADIFCTAIIENRPDHSTSKKLDEIWPDLEKYLESGKWVSSLLSNEQLESELEKLRNTPLFQKCINENKSEFEYGQFILSGRKLVRSALLAYRGDSKAILSSASFQLEDTKEIPEDLSLILSDAQTAEGNLKILETLTEREKKYNSMWQRFIGELKSRMQDFRF